MTVPVAPQDLDAEEAVLGACMISPAAADKALDAIRPGDFYRASHGLILQAIAALRAQGKPADPILVVAELDAAGTLAKVGGRARVLELAALTPAAGNVLHMAERVRDTATKRALILALAAGQEAAWNGLAAADALGTAERVLLEVITLRDRDGRRTIMPSAELAGYVRAKMAAPPLHEAGIPGPFCRARLRPGRLYVLSGYTADGKTAAALQFLRAAVRDGRRVGFASVEMGWQDVADRLVSGYGIPHHQVASGHILPDLRPVAERALDEIAKGRFDVIDDEAIDVAALRRYQRLRGYELLIVDHLHRLDWQERRELERIIRQITNLARSANIPVLLLAQLHRRGDDFPRPTLSSLRETGILEQEAAAVWFVWRKRDEAHLPTEEAEWIVAKNRFGPVGRSPLQFRAAEMRFVEVQE